MFCLLEGRRGGESAPPAVTDINRRGKKQRFLLKQWQTISTSPDQGASFNLPCLVKTEEKKKNNKPTLQGERVLRSLIYFGSATQASGRRAALCCRCRTASPGERGARWPPGSQPQSCLSFWPHYCPAKEGESQGINRDRARAPARLLLVFAFPQRSHAGHTKAPVSPGKAFSPRGSALRSLQRVETPRFPPQTINRWIPGLWGRAGAAPPAAPAPGENARATKPTARHSPLVLIVKNSLMRADWYYIAALIKEGYGTAF